MIYPLHFLFTALSLSLPLSTKDHVMTHSSSQDTTSVPIGRNQLAEHSSVVSLERSKRAVDFSDARSMATMSAEVMDDTYVDFVSTTSSICSTVD